MLILQELYVPFENGNTPLLGGHWLLLPGPLGPCSYPHDSVHTSPCLWDHPPDLSAPAPDDPAAMQYTRTVKPLQPVTG